MPLITADQIVAHLVGDYILQSHWMATSKRQSSIAAGIHAVTYTIPFTLITQNIYALLIISITHFFIDRFGLAAWVVWAKNGFPRDVGSHGFPKDTPPFLAVWLLIIVDNTLHIIINGLAIWMFP